MKVRLLILFFGLVTMFSCTSKKIHMGKIPKEYHGVWVDEFDEINYVITQDSVLIVDYSTDYIDTSYWKIFDIYQVDRSKCDDCNGYGIEISIDNSLATVYTLYLYSYHPKTEKYLTLVIAESLVNPHLDKREYWGEQTFKRVH